jgi:hypothetical protein
MANSKYPNNQFTFTLKMLTGMSAEMLDNIQRGSSWKAEVVNILLYIQCFADVRLVYDYSAV